MLKPIIAILLGLYAGLAAALAPDEAAYLLRRTGFEPAASEVQALLPLDHGRAVERLIEQARRSTAPTSPPPARIDEAIVVPWIPAELKGEARSARRQEWNARHVAMQDWWMQELFVTPSPLAERMTLFWHGHFTSELKKVRYPQLLYRQNLLLRRHALGNYRELLHAVAKDGAMLVYLDSQTNSAAAPNENFARELFELFVLGEGHYTERDVQEAARAFTGWRMRPPDGAFSLDARRHDRGAKTVLGRTAAFSGEQIIDLLLEQPRAAEHIVERLWRELISPQPPEAAVRRLAADFRRNWELAPLVRALLMEPAFRAPENRGLLVKSPVELVVGTVRALELGALPADAAVLASDTMGQALFNPPNVKGWPTDVGWISSETLLARRQFLQFLTGSGRELAPPKSLGRAFGRQRTRSFMRAQRELLKEIGEAVDEASVGAVKARLLVLPPTLVAESTDKPADQLAQALLDPVYQLK